MAAWPISAFGPTWFSQDQIARACIDRLDDVLNIDDVQHAVVDQR